VKGPDWDSSKATDEGSSRHVRETAIAASSAKRCHSRVKSVGWSSGCSGKGQGVWASWSHRGAWKPAPASVWAASCRAVSDGAALCGRGSLVRRWRQAPGLARRWLAGRPPTDRRCRAALRRPRPPCCRLSLARPQTSSLAKNPPVNSTRRRVARLERLERSCAAEKALVAGGGRLRSTYCARGKAQYGSNNQAT